MSELRLSFLQEAISAGIGFRVELRPSSNLNDVVLKDFAFYSALCPEITRSSPNLHHEEVKQVLIPAPSLAASQNSTDFLVLFVRTLTGTTTEVEVSSQDTILSIKNQIAQRLSIPVVQQFLVLAGKPLIDSRTVESYGIVNEQTIHLILRLQNNPTLIDPELLDPQFDYDFTNINDSNKRFTRGGLDYKRPCGWIRFALKVAGKYDGGNDTWLGSNNVPGEWAVSYHGTDKEAMERLIDRKVAENEALAGSYRRGFYSSPVVETAMECGKTFEFQGERYMVVFQNRVNRRDMQVVDNARYYVSSSFDDLRPYSVCIKRV
jgi:hypothetical protein